MCETRRGANVARIPRFLAVTLQVLFKGNAEPCVIRDTLREHHFFSDQQSITPQMLINLKLAIERRRKDVKKAKDFFLQIDLSRRPSNITEDERISLDRFAAQSILSAAMQWSKCCRLYETQTSSFSTKFFRWLQAYYRIYVHDWGRKDVVRKIW